MPERNLPNILDNRTLGLMDNLRFLLSLPDESIDLIPIDPPFGKMDTFKSDPRIPITDREKREERALAALHGVPYTEFGYTQVEDLWEWERDIEKNTGHARFMRELRAEARAYDERAEAGETPTPSLAVRLYRVIDGAMATAGQDEAAYIAFMAQRLVECHRVLKPTGAIYVHCDPKSNSHLRMLLDAIFGSENLRNEIVWCYTGPSAAKQWYPRKHDTILFFAKSPEHRFNGDAVRLPYVADFTPARGVHGANKGTGSEERHRKGRIPTDWWNDGHISNVSGWRNELTGYATQKPIALYERIIAASSNEGDVVLDVFAGCATTAIAAERLNRQWLTCDHAYRSWTMIKRRFYEEGIALSDMTEATPDALASKGLAQARLSYKESRTVGPNDVEPREQVLPALAVAKKSGVRPTTAWSGSIPKQECKNLLRAEFGCVCWGCGKRPVKPNGNPDPAELEVGHMYARRPADGDEGGEDELYNLGLLCSQCNGRMGNRMSLYELRRDREEVGMRWHPEEPLVNRDKAATWAHRTMREHGAQREL